MKKYLAFLPLIGILFIPNRQDLNDMYLTGNSDPIFYEQAIAFQFAYFILGIVTYMLVSW